MITRGDAFMLQTPNGHAFAIVISPGPRTGFPLIQTQAGEVWSCTPEVIYEGRVRLGKFAEEIKAA